MDIWVGYCKRTAKCSHCGEPIDSKESCVFGKLWRQPKDSGGGVRKWTKKLYWHMERKKDGQCCWLVQAKEYLGTKVPDMGARGRKSLVMPKEMREERLSVLRRRARVMQRLRAEMDGESNVDVIVHLGSQLNELKEEISHLGGVPSSWE